MREQHPSNVKGVAKNEGTASSPSTSGTKKKTELLEAAMEATEQVGRKIPEIPVRRADVFDTVVEENNRWKVEFNGQVNDTKHWLGDGIVSLDEEGNPAEYPHFVLYATTEIGEPKALRIYDDVVDGIGTGERHSLTQIAIKTVLKRYASRFGHTPEALKGSLAWSNKLNFQTEFYKLTSIENFSREEAAVLAVQRISFGKHRSAFGYTDFEVSISDATEVVDLKEFGPQNVPLSIYIVAKRGKASQ